LVIQIWPNENWYVLPFIPSHACRKSTHAHIDTARGVAHATPAMSPSQRTTPRPLHPRGPTRSHHACVVAPSLAAAIKATFFTRSQTALELSSHCVQHWPMCLQCECCCCCRRRMSSTDPWTRVQRHRACGDRLPARGAPRWVRFAPPTPRSTRTPRVSAPQPSGIVSRLCASTYIYLYYVPLFS
jgi:hypothetical protein